MQNKLATFALFFPQPLDARDRANLEASSVKRVQLFLGVAAQNPVLADHESANSPNPLRLLDYLHSVGCRLTIRIEEPNHNAGEVAASYYRAGNHPSIRTKLVDIVSHCGTEAAIAGNEPEGDFSLERSDDPKANWGDKGDDVYPQGKAWEHQSAVGQLRATLIGTGIELVTPGYRHRRVRPDQPPQPGKAMWARICTTEYDKCYAGGAHIYSDALLGDEDRNRYKWAVGEELERIHTQVWINETNINTHNATDLQRMQACMGFYEMLAALPWTGAITSFCPFVSNGLDGQEWSHMRMMALEAYQSLGRWMAA